VPVYDREAIYKTSMKHLYARGICAEGQPFVIPTMFARIGDAIYFHGSAASRMLRGLSGGVPSALPSRHGGLVLARSISITHELSLGVALGKATLIDDPPKTATLRAFTEKLIPGRWNDARQPNEKELKATSILRLP